MPLAVFNFSNTATLAQVNAKVGMENNPDFVTVVYLNNCPSLRYICANESQVPTIANNLVNLGMPLVQVNSYCSFNPGGSYNTIEGDLTFDTDANGCDAGDFLMPSVRMKIDDGTNSGITFTSNTGHYRFYTASGNFTVAPEFEIPYFTLSPVSANVNLTDMNSAVENRHFCLTPSGTQHDVEIKLLPVRNARPGFDAVYKLIYKNKGNQTQSGAVNIIFEDSVLDFVASSPLASTATSGNLSWTYSNLMPFETRIIDLTLNVNSPTETPAVNIGDMLNFTATITPTIGDAFAQDNTMQIHQTVSGSFDPNDKICLEGPTITPEMVGQYLNYVIRFQNSGNAAAENIVVKDMIDVAKFDIGSLQLTANSRPATTRISGNKVEFLFNGINLPTQTDNEPASHGFVAFKIKTKSDLGVGNSVSNSADIYFDYNFPITTEPAVTTVSVLGKDKFEDTNVSVVPNPVKDRLTITAKGKITSVQLFDLQGRLVQSATENDTIAIFNLANHANGVYFVKVYTEKGVRVEKIIKE